MLEEVHRQRQRRTVISLIVVAILVGTIGYGVYTLSQSKGGGNFPFPCLAEVTTVHVHPWLQISINLGAGITNVTIPTAVGILDPQITNGLAGGGSCFEPMHTHDSSGIIHVEAASVSGQYTLGAFFQIWQVTYGTVNVNGVSRPVVFNNTDILGYKNDGTHTVSLLVDGKPFTGTTYASLDLAQYDYCSAQTTAPPCYPTAGGAPQWPGGVYPYGTGHQIVIYYA